MRLFGNPIPRPDTYEGKQELKAFNGKHDHVFEVRGYTTDSGIEGGKATVENEYGTSNGDGKVVYYLKKSMPTTTLLKRCEVCNNFTTETIRGEWTAAQLGLDE